MPPIIEFLWIHPKLLEIRWEERIDTAILHAQLALYHSFQKKAGVESLRIGYHTLNVLFTHEQSGIQRITWEEELTKDPVEHAITSSSQWEIPVCYELGKDLEMLARMKGLTTEQLIELHSSQSYLLHFYGFLPGFMYLGGLDTTLHTNRKITPDPQIAPGSVGIGGAQTGIYTLPSPGGWHIIGKTPLTLFNPKQEPPVRPQIGDSIVFRAISLSAYQALEKAISQGSYEWNHE